MKRMTTERLAEIEAVYIWQVDCGDLHITFQEMAEELLQALKAERAVINAVKALPRYCYGLGDSCMCVDADELELVLT